MIKTSRFNLRQISVELDDFSNYFSWMTDKDSNVFILGVSPSISIEYLKNYVREKNEMGNALLLGIYSNTSGNHIGNIKFEPINRLKSESWLGILIGDKSYRNRGVGFEVLTAGIKYLNDNQLISTFHLGVDVDNKPAISLYEKLGFKKNLDLTKEIRYQIMTKFY